MMIRILGATRSPAAWSQHCSRAAANRSRRLGGGVSRDGFTAPDATSPHAPVGPDRSQQRLFVTEYTSNTVLVYNATVNNPSPKAHHDWR